MSAHTPGPWNFEPEFNAHVIKGMPNENGYEEYIASTWGGERYADARLISAAPDLLAALEDLFGADMEHCMMGDGKDDQIAAIAAARAAIAKATGAAHPTE